MLLEEQLREERAREWELRRQVLGNAEWQVEQRSLALHQSARAGPLRRSRLAAPSSRTIHYRWITILILVEILNLVVLRLTCSQLCYRVPRY